MILYDQRILADPQRGDGKDARGVPGDCLRACVASLFGMGYADVPHFVLYRSWFDYMRSWAREFGIDFACYETVQDMLNDATPAPELLLATGKSPRGDFLHVVLADAELQLVHDPHPSRSGIGELVDVIIPCAPYWPPPQFPVLP